MAKPSHHGLIGENYDARLDESVIGVPTPDDLVLWTKPAAQFIRSSAGITEAPFVWVGKRPLGEGAFGLAGLWEKIDQEGNVVDRMVIKQIGPTKNGDWNAKVPTEVQIMEEMRKTGSAGVVELRGYRRYRHHQMHRIYMEFCPHGDLRRLYKRYRKFKQYLPEPFLWEIFYYLADVCAAMVNGPPDVIWDSEIVHRDIKPGNIFLGTENPHENPFYPVAKLGDWGLAVQTGIHDGLNPYMLMGAGTRQYMAPEQRLRARFPPFLTRSNRRVSNHTNIWGIGATMYELLTLHHVWPVLFKETDPEGTIEGLPEITTGKVPEYSYALRSLIQQCLRPRADHRPCIADVQRMVGEYRQMLAKELSERREAQGFPLDEERLYYRGNEIETMQLGDWKPSMTGNLEGPESGFQDPDFTPINFPNVALPAPNSDDSSSGDGDEATIRAGSRSARGLSEEPVEDEPAQAPMVRVNKFGRAAMNY